MPRKEGGVGGIRNPNTNLSTGQFPRIDYVELVSRADVESFVPGLRIGSDGILVSKRESSSSLIYWKDGEFHFHWLGD